MKRRWKSSSKNRNETEYKRKTKLIKMAGLRDWVKKVLCSKRKREMKTEKMKKKTWGDKQAMSTWKKTRKGKGKNKGFFKR